jgi:LCP family protein required for cell wall assembly
MAVTGRRALAAALSAALPGAGQLYAGARARGAVLLAAALAGVLGLAAVVIAADPVSVAETVLRRDVAALLLAANLGVFAFRAYAVVDAWRLGGRAAAAAGPLALAVLAVALAVTALPHAAVGYYGVRGYDALAAVFAEDEPRDVLPSRGVFLVDRVGAEQVRADAPVARAPRPQEPRPTPFRGRARPLLPRSPEELVRAAPGAAVAARKPATPAVAEARPWVTLLLVGSDAGPERPGNRTDTMIVVALERGTGRAAALGIPRNLAGVPFTGAARRDVKRFPLPLNALYDWGLAHPALFPGGADPGATALKQTISNLLGIRIDYYALVDLDGFVDMVDALGGVTIHVKERIVDSVTRPAWGETKPRIDVVPGRTYHFSGRTALAYVRSRKASSDYTRMARQRCFLSALAGQLDVRSVLRHFGRLATIAEESVRTDIPLDRVPDLVRLAAGVDPRLTVTETFGLDYIRGRRAGDGYPLPAVNRMRAAVRDLILLPPEDAAARRGVETAARSC